MQHMCEKLGLHSGWMVHGCSQHMLGEKSHDDRKIPNFCLLCRPLLQLLVCESRCIIIMYDLVIEEYPFFSIFWKIWSCFFSQ